MRMKVGESVRKVARILQLRQGRWMSTEEIARKAGLEVARARLALEALADFGFIEKEGKTRLFLLRALCWLVLGGGIALVIGGRRAGIK